MGWGWGGASIILHEEEVIADYVPKQVGISAKNLISKYFSIHSCSGKNAYIVAAIQNYARAYHDSTTALRLFSGLLRMFCPF